MKRLLLTLFFLSIPVLAHSAISITLDGKLRDKVGQGDQRRIQDGQSDGTFTLTFQSGSKTVAALELTNSKGGVWNTVPDAHWTLGVAGGLDSALANTGNDSLTFSVATGTAVKIFAADYQDIEFTNGTQFSILARFSDGSSDTGTVTIGAAPPPPPSQSGRLSTMAMAQLQIIRRD